MKYGRKIAASLVIVSMMSGMSLQASAVKYSDVPSWAEQAVDVVSNKGYLVGDINGRFNPDSSINKFDLVDVLAKVAGYRDPLVTINMPQSEKDEITIAVAKYKELIGKYENAYRTWDRSQTEKIAYLIRKGILDQSDLSEFIDKTNGIESRKIVSRQELTKYITRILGLENEALIKGSGYTTFYDDSEILNEYKPYVSMIKEKGIITGSNNKFNPKGNVSKATLAIVLSNTLKCQQQMGNKQPVVTPGESYLRTIQGEVTKFLDYTSIRGVYIKGYDKFFIFDANVNYYRDNIIKYNVSLTDMVSIGDTVSIQVGNDDHVKAIYTTTNRRTEENKPEIEDGNKQFDDIYGTITKIEEEYDDYRITIQVRYESWGDIVTKDREYLIDSDAKIKQNGEERSVSKLELGSKISAKVSNKYLYEAITQTRNHDGVGKLVGRKMTATKNYLLIEDEYKRVQKYLLTSKTDIERNSHNASWTEIRIGDELTFEAELDELTEIYADGDKSKVKGTIVEIEISDNPKIVVEDEDGDLKTIGVSYNANISIGRDIGSIHDLRIGQYVSAKLQSEEVYDMDVDEDDESFEYVGYIEDCISSDTIMVKVKNINDDSLNYYLRLFDIEDAKVYKINGNEDTDPDLDEGMEVEIRVTEQNESKANRVKILKD